jgi:large subunit ribosomal protein L22
MATVETEMRTDVRAEARYVRTAPRKAQLVAEQIRGRTVPEARTILAFMTRDAARDMEKVLNSAVANAEANHGLVGDDLVVSAAYVGAGPVLKRWRARARGRVARIRKRTCHITIHLEQPDGGPLPEARAALAETVTPEAPAEEAKPRRQRKKPEVAETTDTPPRSGTRDKPKTRPKRAQKPKGDAAEGKPKHAARQEDEATDDEGVGAGRDRPARRRKQTDEEKES